MVLPRSARSAITSVTFQSARRLFGLISRPGDFARTDRVMALFAPLTLLALAAVWLTFVLAGFTLLFWVAGYGSWAESFRVSGSSLLTLGTAGLAETGHRLLGFAAAAIGLGLVALLISFLPSLYAAFARREQLVALLEVRAGSPPSAVVMLERFERLGWSDSLSAEWDRWETWFVDIDESHTSYPALVWLRSPHPERSWVTASGTVLDAASLLLAGSLLWREHIGHDHAAVDGTLRSADGQEINCQGTRVERRTLAARGGTGRATSHEDNDSLAANVIAAFESKLNSADSKMILVLDANDAPAYTDDPHVVEIARRTLSERGLLDRWAEAWLVGPTTRRTTRIDSVVRPRQINDRDVPPLPVIADDPGE